MDLWNCICFYVCVLRVWLNSCIVFYLKIRVSVIYIECLYLSVVI